MPLHPRCVAVAVLVGLFSLDWLQARVQTKSDS